MSEHVIPRKTYIWVWVALMALMMLTAGLSRINLGEWSTVVALVIAAIKALLVVLFFMHVRYEDQKMAWVFVLAGFFWLAILLTLTMTDYMSRGYLGIAGH
ncbi:MAG TPA: cytochrome C oxidase subunit IV family protein [Terriglobales bacterium]|jgi:cytochrome c oxidase subunit 4|nr:cytochrome C oxidase subunit IV family protein [Terriglobales bacterium]